MAEKIIGIYKITNTVTGDFYIGSSKNVKRRWKEHKYYIKCKNHPNNPMYLDMQKYGVDKFVFEILEETESEHLKETEQKFIETLKPTYNNNRANGMDIEINKKKQKKYNNQLCYYDDEILTLNALRQQFKKYGVENPTKEAKKYLVL